MSVLTYSKPIVNYR